MTSARAAILTASSAAAICGASVESTSGLPNSENLRGDRPRSASTMLSITLNLGNRLVIWKVRDTPSWARRGGGRPGGGQAGYIVAVEGDGPAGWRQNSGNGIEERGLAGAVGTDDGAALAARD